MEVSDGWFNYCEFIYVVYGFRWFGGVYLWFDTVGLVGTENLEFIDCLTYGVFSIRVSVLRLAMIDFNWMLHSLTTGHRNPLNNATSDFYLGIFPSYMFTSSPY